MAKGIVIRNSQEQLAVDIMIKAHAILCEKLQVKTDLTFQRECNWGKNARHAGWYLSSEKLVALNFRNMYGATIVDLLEVLGHEMRHAVQDVNGWHKLHSAGTGANKMRRISGTWKGERMFVPYFDAPWEVDAREYEKPYAEIVTKELGLSDEILNTKLPMGTSSTSDQNATYKLLVEKYTKAELNLLASSWLTKKPKESGYAYVLTSDLPEGFSFKNRENCKWLKENQQVIQFEPYIKITEEYGGFSVREMCS